MSAIKDWGFRSWISFAVLSTLAHSATGWIYQPESTFGKLAVIALSAGIAILIVRALSPRTEDAAVETESVAVSQSVVDPEPELNAWQRLGVDPQAREASINRMFDSATGKVEYATLWDFEYTHTPGPGTEETAYSSMSFCISRDVAAIAPRERELLRATYLLYNAGLLAESAWRDLAFCFVYGDGKAAIESFDYREPVALPFSGGPGALGYYADAHHATVDGAATKLRAILASVAQRPDTPPLARELMARLDGV